MSRSAHYTDVRPLVSARIEDVERVDPALNPMDDVGDGKKPWHARVADLGDVIVRALRMRFGDAGDLAIRHDGILPKRGRTMAKV